MSTEARIAEAIESLRYIMTQCSGSTADLAYQISEVIDALETTEPAKAREWTMYLLPNGELHRELTLEHGSARIITVAEVT